VRSRSQDLDLTLRLMAGPGGVVTYDAIRRFKISPEVVTTRLRDRWLSRDGPGVYVIEHLRDDITPLAVVQARYPGAVAAGRTAAWLHGMDGYDRADYHPPDLVAHPDHHVPGRVRPRPPNLMTTPVSRGDVMELRGIRVLRVLPTLRSLGAVADIDAVEAAVEWALRTGAVQEKVLWVWAEHQPRDAPGRDTLLAALHRRGQGIPPTESHLETLTVQRVLRPAGLAHRRQVPVWIDGSFLGRYDFELECGLLVEASGAATHATPEGLQRDASHGMRLRLAGREVEHLTWDDVTRRPVYTQRRLLDYVVKMTHGQTEQVFDSLEACAVPTP
jgi:hypothetical protein